jgi:transcriptional regulator with XRE-family HTH domain
MATTIYESGTVHLIDGTELYITPLKLKYLREFMQSFEAVRNAKGDAEAISALAECARVCMKQFYPSIKTIEDLEDSVNLPTIYKLLDLAADIKINEDEKEETVKDQAVESGSTWDDLDLAKLESEVFLLGIWKDFEELERSISMPELISILNIKRDLDYEEKRFFAGIQGVDLDKQNGGKSGQDIWEEKKAKFFSGGATGDPNDIVSYQGPNAAKAGFGIGMGLGYEKLVEN